MSRFVTPENWGRIYTHSRIPRITLDFLPLIGEKTIHHEPPKFLLRPGVEIILDHAGHATFHRLRWEMFGRQEDHDAFMAQASLMNEAEAELENKLRDSPKILDLIRREIKRRR